MTAADWLEIDPADKLQSGRKCCGQNGWTDPPTITTKSFICITGSLGAPSGARLLGSGPLGQLWALRACLITSFRRSGHVTHATVQWWDSALEKSKKSRRNPKTIAKGFFNSFYFLLFIFLYSSKNFSQQKCVEKYAYMQLTNLKHERKWVEKELSLPKAFFPFNSSDVLRNICPFEKYGS